MLAAKLLKPSCAVANLHYQTHCSAAAPLKAATGRASQQGSEAQTSNKLSFKPSISMRPITTNVNVLLAGGYQYLGKTFKELKTEHGNKATSDDTDDSEDSDDSDDNEQARRSHSQGEW